MLIFIALSLALCFLVQTDSFLQNELVSPLLIYIGVCFALISILGVLIKKMPVYFWYDTFSSSTLLTWFAYWKPLFKDDSPIFFFYPLYFVFTASFMTLYLISQRQKIDNQTLYYMRWFVKDSILQPWLVMPGVLLSLELQQHYLLFPVMMTLLMIRFAFSSCLDHK